MAKRKLDAKDVLDLAHELIDENNARDRMYDALDDLYDQKKAGSKDDEDSVVRMTMPYATNAVDLVADLASQAEMALTVPAAKETMDAKKAADQQEAWLLAVKKGNERRTDENHNADLAWITAQRGICALKTIFTDALLEKNEDGYEVVSVPVIMQVKDTRHIYPRWSATGTECVVEARKRKVGDIRRHHPGALSEKNYSHNMEVDWIEYWDDTYRMYFADGKPVSIKGRESVPHGYGVVPYAFGRARGTPREVSDQRYRPLLRGVSNIISNMDVWFSILATAGWSAVTSAWMMQSDDPKDIDLRPGAINYIALNETIAPLQRAPLPSDFFQLGTLLIQAFQQGSFPFALYGESPGDLAGYAINLLNQAGRRPLAPIWSAIEKCYERAFYNVVHIAKNKVAPLVGDRVPLSIVIQSSEPGLDKKPVRRNLTLNTKEIDRSFDVSVKLTDPLPADKAGNLRMAIEATGAKLLSKETALQTFGIVMDPTAEMDRMAAEDVYARLAPIEGLRLAIERGYIPDPLILPKGWVLGPDGQPMPEALVPGRENPTAMNGLDGQPEMEALNAMAAGMPTQEQPQVMPNTLPPVMGGGPL